MTIYNKLVRDLIPDHIVSKGGECKFHTASPEEFEQKLLEKILEEGREIIANCSLEEIADMMEVLEAVVELKGYDWGEIKKKQQEKKEKRGGFTKKIILEES
jgi:predicted house-cleaning noncanonical NTP pyrophosphatase (MazG superfamily)